MAEYKQIRDPQNLIGEKIVSVYGALDAMILATESGRVLRVEPQHGYEGFVELDYKGTLHPSDLRSVGVISEEEEAAMYSQAAKERESRMRQQELKQLRDLEKKYGDVRT
jgi:hypothetical protein